MNKLAKAEGKNASAVIKELLESYVKDGDISVYIDDLWSCTGAKLKSRGVKPEDIEQAIRYVRTEK